MHYAPPKQDEFLTMNILLSQRCSILLGYTILSKLVSQDSDYRVDYYMILKMGIFSTN